jgi:hypothetical protein
MKLTIVTGPRGELVAVIRAHLSEHNRTIARQPGPHASIKPRPGQAFHEIEVPEHYGKLSVAELHRQVLDHLPSEKRPV